MGKVVSLVRAHSSEEEIRNSISKALDLIDFKPHGQVNSVVIKPNLCYYWNAATGYTTDPRVVGGIIDCIRETYGQDTDVQIVEADATAMRTEHAFVMLGYKKLAEEKDVQLFNLSTDDIEKKKVKVNEHEFTFEAPRLLSNSDLFINVPKLKIMRDTRITCALKNIFGCIATPRKSVYHPFLNEAIVGINKILRPHLTIVDGLVALGQLPVKLDLLMASADPFSVDWIASQILGYNPQRVEFLRLAINEGLGNTEGITTRGERISTLKSIFPRANFSSSKWWWGIQFWLLKTYNRIAKDVIPPDLEGI